MNKIRVLPVYPRFPETFWGGRTALEYIGKKAVMPPLGLLTVLAMLPEDRFEIHRIIDLNVEPLTDEHLKNSDIVFISAMIPQEISHNEIIRRAHKHGKPVAAGGPFPTSYPERSGADHIVAGEAEVTLPAFLKDLVNGNPRKIYTEKDVIKEGRCKVELTKMGKPCLTQTPVPRWDLIDLKLYYSATIQYSRGCPRRCEFCEITHLFGREPRTKTPEQMIAEFNALHKTGYHGNVQLVDDNIIGNGKNLRAFLPYGVRWQEERGYPFEFDIEASMDLAWDFNKDLLGGLVKLGVSHAFLGIESTEVDVLKIMGKSQNSKMPQLEAVRRIQQAGIVVTAGVIVGNDGEKPDIFDKLFNFIQKAGIVGSMPGLLRVPRNTDLYARLKKEGRLREEARGVNTHHFSFDFVPEQDEELLIKGYKNLLAKLFDPKNYYARDRILQKNLGPNYSGGRINLKGVIAFGKLFKRQLFAKSGIKCARYLAKTAIRNPSYFVEAVTQAIKLDHYRTITTAALEADDYIPQTKSWYEQFAGKVREICSRRGKKDERIGLTANRIIVKAERRYQKLHEDFREGAERALENLRQKVRSLEESCRTPGLESTAQF